jgi:hydrophobic/amphiphilic exporter-1 (mainly G- bacteria), HAE1 family
VKHPKAGRTFITTRPIAILMVVMATVVFGWLSYRRLPVTLMPELSYPTLTVRTEYPGAAPEEVENDVSRPIEEQVGVIGGLKKLSSISRAGVSDVVLEFAWSTPMSEATQTVLEKLDLVFLPDEANRPLILHYDPSLDPVLELSLSGHGDRFTGEPGLRRLRRLADLRIKKEIEPIKGVAAVRVRGGLEEEIQVLLDEDALLRTGISIQHVIDRLAQENINVAGGTLKEGRIEYLVRTLNEYEELGQIESTIVATRDGRDVRVGDIGRVERSHKDREIVTRADGGESIQIEIFKEGDANLVALANRVHEALGEFDPDKDAAAAVPGAQPAQPVRRGPSGLIERIWKDEGAKLQLVADRSVFVQSSIDEVVGAAVSGGLLAVLVLYLFLRNLTSTAIIAVGIPVALLVTFAPLHLLGVSLNVMSLGGLALGVGMLVDSSIVVLESIYRRREDGDDPITAVERGTSEVRGAVWSSSLASVAVFFPMVFVEGIAGQAFGDLGLAVVVSQLMATAAAVYFLPMLVARAGLGLGVSGAVGLVLTLISLSVASPRVGQTAMLVLLALLVVGLVAGILRARRNRGTEAARLSGLYRWVSLGRLRSSIGVPAALFGRMFRWPMRGRARILRLVLLPVVWILAPVVALVGWIYVVGIRFLLGTVFEWVLGKPILLSFHGLTGLGRGLVPFLGRAFGSAVWLPLRLTGSAMSWLETAYPRVLRPALAHPGLIAAVVVACFGITWRVARTLDSELLPEVHQGEFAVEVQLPVGTPVETTESLVAPIERAILEHKDAIRALILTVGYDPANTQRSDEGEHTARFKILLTEAYREPAQEQRLIDGLRRSLAAVPDLKARVVRPVLFSFKTPIEVEVHGNDLARLKDVADEVRERMEALPELADVETTLHSGAPEVQIVYDRDRVARYGLNVRDVARLVRDKVQGHEATRFNLHDRRIPIVVRLGLADRETVEDVRSIVVNPGGDRPIGLASVADVTLGEGPSEVRRIDGRRVAVVGANIALGSLSRAVDQIDEELGTRMSWPSDMTYLISGQNDEWQRSRASLWLALGLSVFLVYVIMAMQFESLLQPLVIMLTLPLASVGTVLTLKALGLALSIIVFLGLIILAGIVVNNAIVLLDYVNTLRERGLSREEAIVTAGRVRLRPILMTTGTAVLGLVPMALGFGEGAEIRAPMAIAVISGLTSSTLLTLVVIPSIYALVDSWKQRLLGLERAPGAGPADAIGASEVVTP